jgi:diguanylate cyclase (GGDEF)-like protein
MKAGIRARLFFLAALCVLPFIALVIHLAEERRTHELQVTRDKALMLARLIGGKGSLIVEHAEQVLASLAVAEDHPALLGPDCSQRLGRLMKVQSIYGSAAVSNRAGDVQCASTPLSKPLNLADREHFQRAMKSGGTATSDIIKSRLTGELSIVVAEPLFDRNGQAAGVLNAGLNLEWVRQTLFQAELAPGSILSIVDHQGRIVARYPDESYVGERIPDHEQFTRLAATRDEGGTEIIGHDHVERFAAYAKFAQLSGGPAYVRVAIPVAVVDAERRTVLREGALVLAGVLALSLLAVSISGGILLVQPIRALTRTAERLGKGDFAARTGVPHTRSEIGVLARTLDQLAVKVERTTRALQALSDTNRTIARETDELSLLTALCRAAVNDGFRLAMIHYATNDEAKSLLTMARAGQDEGFVDALDLSWADGEGGTAGEAVRTGRYSVINSIAADPRYARWRDEAMRRGFRSVISIPLTVDGKVIGAATLIAGEEATFDEHMLEFVQQVSADLSFGIGTIRSRIKREAAERRAERAATHDTVTDLPNASAFLARVQGEIARSRAAGAPLTVLLVHLPRLQEIFDGLGYDPANAIVRQIATRLKALEISPDALARTGTEDFAIVLPGMDQPASARHAHAVQSALQTAVHTPNGDFDVQAAVGTSCYPGHGDDADLLMRRAGIAAREAGRKGLEYLSYKGATERENPERLALAADLRGAIARRDLTLHYQSKLDLATNRVASCEALIRWPHATKGMISPVQFVPVAEQTGQIRELTYFVLDSAVRQQRAWLDEGKRTPIAVNLSVRNLYDPRLVEHVEGLLATWGLPPALIEFEITESALMEEPTVAKATIAALRDKGFKIYIDDFGTGYSSLSYLVSLPVHALKIDRAFVQQMTRSREAHSVVASVISMAHGLGLRVVAEGVETAEELEQLSTLGCDEAQGYFIARPVEAARFVHAA